MKFKVGDLIIAQAHWSTGETLVEAIIVKRWQTDEHWSGDVIDNVHLYITFDATDPTAVNDIDMVSRFRDSNWSLKNEA